MKKIVFAFATLLTCFAATAGSYQISHSQNLCSPLRERTVYNLVNQVGWEEGFDLATPRRIYAEVLCTSAGMSDDNGSPFYVYVFRASVEKPINDDGVQKWVSLRQDLDRIGFGVLTIRNIEDAIRSQTRILLRSHKGVR